MTHPFNRAWGAILPLKKELYRGEDIKAIEEATNVLIEQFKDEGILIYADVFKTMRVRGIEIQFKTVSDNISYVDMDTLKINLIQ
jgi:hypothetical protein